MNYKYLDNAFWERDDKTKVKCIKITDLPDGKEKKDILSVDKFLPTGEENPLFKEIIDSIGIETIDKSHNERIARKEREAANGEIFQAQKEKTKELEALFGAKIRAFEIDAVKETKNKKLRSALRRAKNELEVTALTSLIVGESLGVLELRNEDE